MSIIEITRVADAGERCWVIRLLNENGETVVESAMPLTKGAAHATAKGLKHGAARATILSDEMANEGGTGAVANTAGNGPSSMFTQIEETAFRICLPTDGEEPIEAVEVWFTDAEIRWSPPEEDPAHRAKESDQTVTKGVPGS